VGPDFGCSGRRGVRFDRVSKNRFFYLRQEKEKKPERVAALSAPRPPSIMGGERGTGKQREKKREAAARTDFISRPISQTETREIHWETNVNPLVPSRKNPRGGTAGRKRDSSCQIKLRGERPRAGGDDFFFSHGRAFFTFLPARTIPPPWGLQTMPLYGRGGTTGGLNSQRFFPRTTKRGVHQGGKPHPLAVGGGRGRAARGGKNGRR